MKDQDVPRLGKAVELLRLARLLQGSYCGLGIAEICRRFEVGRRTAEQMLKAIQQIYPDCVESWDDDGRKRWRIPASPATETRFKPMKSPRSSSPPR